MLLMLSSLSLYRVMAEAAEDRRTAEAVEDRRTDNHQAVMTATEVIDQIRFEFQNRSSSNAHHVLVFL